MGGNTESGGVPFGTGCCVERPCGAAWSFVLCPAFRLDDAMVGSERYLVIRSVCFFFSSRRRHTRYWRDWSSDVCSSDLHWLIKGGGGAHLREKVVAAAAERFVVIVSADKVVDALSWHVPLELVPFGMPATCRAVGDVRVRPDTPRSPDGGVIADRYGPIGDPAALARDLDAVPGVMAHGLFPPDIVA